MIMIIKTSTSNLKSFADLFILKYLLFFCWTCYNFFQS